MQLQFIENYRGTDIFKHKITTFYKTGPNSGDVSSLKYLKMLIDLGIKKRSLKK